MSDNLLTASDIFSGGENPYERLEIPEIIKNGQPGVVYLKPLSTKTIMQFRKMSDDKQDHALLGLIQQSAVNPDGSKIFSSPEDVKRLQQGEDLSMAVFNRISGAVLAQMNPRKSDSKEKDEDAKGGDNENENPLAPTGSDSNSTDLQENWGFGM